MNVLGLATALPVHGVGQTTAASMSARTLGADASRERLLHALYRRSGVGTRHSVLLEDGDGGVPRQSFFRPAAGPGDRGPSTAERMIAYEAHAAPLAERAARGAIGASGLEAGEITHVITVTCTGFRAPGTDVALIKRLGLKPDVGRAQIGFMGCSALFNALGIARAITASDEGARVLVTAVELSSLHFPYAFDSERLVGSALFADGAASLVCAGRGSSRAVASIDRTASVLFPESEDALTWTIGDHGFEMTLAPSVPRLIAEHVAEWLRAWLAEAGLRPHDVRTWAVHPGGPRILSSFARAVGLEEVALEHSQDVLSRCGNMSSATIAFILERLLAHQAPSPAVAVAFGPGMVAEGMLLRLDGGAP